MYATKTLIDDSIIPKSMIECTNAESKQYEWNIKGLYVVIRAVTFDEYQRIQAYWKSKRA